MQKTGKKFAKTASGNWQALPSTIGFRLDEEHTSVLFERAEALKIGIHDLARQYVIQMLHEADEREQLIAAIVSLKDEIVEARKDVAISTQELLVSAGRATISQSKGWVKENLVLTQNASNI